MPRRHRTRACSLALVAMVAVGCGSDAVTDRAPTASTTDPDPATAPPTTGADAPPATDTPATTTLADLPEDTMDDTDTAPPSTTAPTTTSATPPAPDDTCVRLTDFDTGDGNDGWFVVNDGVMGGRSAGRIDIADSVLRFTGTVVTQGGGFTSVRLRLDGSELAGTDRLELRVRTDGRTYGLTMEDDGQYGQRSISHRADLAIDGSADGWSTATLRYAELTPTVFGQVVDADPFDPEQARELGIIIADGTDGEFALEVDWIDACA